MGTSLFSGAFHGSSAEQEIAVEARDAPLARCVAAAGPGGRADDRRGSSSPPREPDRLLSRQESDQDQGRISAPGFRSDEPRHRPWMSRSQSTAWVGTTVPTSPCRRRLRRLQPAPTWVSYWSG